MPPLSYKDMWTLVFSLQCEVYSQGLTRFCQPDKTCWYKALTDLNQPFCIFTCRIIGVVKQELQVCYVTMCCTRWYGPPLTLSLCSICNNQVFPVVRQVPDIPLQSYSFFLSFWTLKQWVSFLSSLYRSELKRCWNELLFSINRLYLMKELKRQFIV